MNKVKFGLSNVHVLFIDKYDPESKTYTFEKKAGETNKVNIMPIPGAVNISLDPQGDKSEFYADDIAYYVKNANTGYSGDLVIATIPDWFRQKALGEIVDKNGVLLESADAVTKEFVMMFEVNGDVTKTRFITYRNTISRPSIKGQTVESSITPSTDAMTITAMPRENDHFTVGHISGDVTDATAKAAYAAWYTDMHEPNVDDSGE